MLTIFSCPKAFKGHFGVIQRNAIRSWSLLKPRPEIILFGDDDGTAEFCLELGLRHYPGIRRGPQGTPFLNFIFETAAGISVNDTLCYLNADVMLTGDFLPAISKVDMGNYVIAGRRWDLDVDAPVDFSAGWEERLREKVALEGVRHGFSGIDYFVFLKAFRHEMPDFYIGRAGWDNWFLWRAKQYGLTIVDATESVLAVHQNHDYSHSAHGGRSGVVGLELVSNLRLLDGYERVLTLRSADCLLIRGGISALPFRRMVLKRFIDSKLGNALLALKRKRLRELT